jgi:hypothetical protein
MATVHYDTSKSILNAVRSSIHRIRFYGSFPFIPAANDPFLPLGRRGSSGGA